MARPAPLIDLLPEPRTVLECLARSRETAHSLVQRAQIVLRAADGERSKAIAQTLGLNQTDLKPHRTRYWLHPNIEDEVGFRQDVRTLCKLYHQAAELHEQGVHVICTDEKTGIQALEPIGKPLMA